MQLDSMVAGMAMAALTAMATGMAGSAGAAPEDGRAVETGEVSREVKRTTTYQYALAFPSGYEAVGERRWPMVIDLHGSGLRGLSTLKRMAGERDDRFVWLLPRHDGRGWWDVDTLAKMIDEVVEAHRVDPERVSVIGFSLGGFGAWELAASHPHKIAAIAPIAGGGNPFTASRMPHVPVWAFHGAKDDAVYPKLAEVMVDAVERAGGEAKLTMYPEVGHDCLGLTMSNAALFDWLHRQRRRTRARDEWVVRTATIAWMAEAPKLDGRVGREKAWRAATEFAGFMRPLAMRPDDVQTTVHVGYNDERLFVAIEAWDPAIDDLRVERTERDAEVWLDDSVEVLIGPDPKRQAAPGAEGEAEGEGEGEAKGGRGKAVYYQFVANAVGALYDGKGFDGKWDAEGVESAASKLDDRWVVELAIPWKAMDRSAPAEGETLGMLFARNHRPPGRPSFITQWPPTNGRGNHAPDRFATMTAGPRGE